MDALAELLNLPPSSIEILPGDIAEWETDAKSSKLYIFAENHLGVPIKSLYRAYLQAIPLFNSALKLIRTSTRPRQEEKDIQLEDPWKCILSTSSVILLANPAHSTALNARKHLVRYSRLSPARVTSLSPEHELQFTAVLLFSTPETTKQGLLWHHRRWLLQLLYRGGGGAHFSSELGLCVPMNVIRNELALATKACEVYPRNYYAWTHKQVCVDVIVSHINSRVSCPMKTVEEEAEDSIVASEIVSTRRWIETHPSDYSAVHYLRMLYTSLASLYEVTTVISPILSSGLQDRLLSESAREANIPPIMHPLDLLRTYPTHETLWMYLRAMLTVDLGTPQSSVEGGTRTEVMDVIAEISGENRGGGVRHTALGVVDEGIIGVEWNARRFLNWQARLANDEVAMALSA